MKQEIIPQEFYFQDTIEVARQLLGKILVVSKFGKKISGIISETEAYLGFEDPACHSSHGKITERTKTFYLPGGHSYVYLIYGMYFCFNIITGNEKQPEAVLIRAVFPLDGIKEMHKNSPHVKNLNQLANGPGKLCRSFGIDNTFNQLPVFNDGNICIMKNQNFSSPKNIQSGSRIGIQNTGDAAHWPLRFWINESPC